MKIHYLKTQNYRQYRDTHIEFSTDLEKNFTVIQGDNGAGKTNILNAITWCLYGEEKHLEHTDSQKLPIANEKLCHELGPGHMQRMNVEIGLGREEIEYIISRSAQIYRRTSGDLSIVPDPDPTVLFLIRSDWKTSEQPNFAIKSLLPENISQFFLFDGERLNRFFQRDSAERVKKGIVDVSQIDLLDTANKHLRRVHSDILKKSPNMDAKVEEQKKLYEEAEQELKACETRLEALHADLEGVKQNIEEINEKLRESPDEEVRKLQEERDALNKEIEDYELELAELIKNACNNLREVGPIIYTYAALDEALARIRSKVDHGELPPIVREPFFKGLLDQGVCVCGTPLLENSESRRKVLERMQSLTTAEDYMSKAADGRYRLDSTTSDLPKRIQRQQGIGKNIRRFEEAIRDAKRRLKEISQKIEKYGEVNLEEIQLLEQQLKQYEEKKPEINRAIGMAQQTYADTEKKRDEALKNYHKALKLDKKQRDLLIRSQICSDALGMLEQVRGHLLTETREKIQAQTEEYFLRLIWKKATYKSVRIDENYRLNVENIRGLPSLGTLSAGERQVLALAFTAALGTISGFDAPIVIDTPTGRISGRPRENIAEVLPDYLSDTQVTLLMTDTEYTDNVRVRLAHRVGMEYDLVFDEDEAVTRVIKRGG